MRVIDADKVKELIRGSLSVDTDADKEYVCGLIDEISSSWISVKDRLPDNQNPVIVYVPPHTNDECESYIGYVGMAYYTTFGDGFWCGTDGNVYGAIGIIHSPTHWMPLPEPPKDGEVG